MISRERYLQWISGRRRGPVDGMARGVLAALEPLYRLAVVRKNRHWDRKAAARVSVPVISVGNLTAGGTGKTPLVRWIATQLTQRGHCPALVSRGYGARSGELNDEARELQLYLPETPHVQQADRVAAAQSAIARYAPTCLILDDGFQHRRLHRDVDIVLVDATDPFGHNRLIPRGLLREPVSSLRRADFVIVTRVDQVGDEELERIETRLGQWLPAERIARAVFSPQGLLGQDGRTPALADLRDQPVLGFCGIGNPASFRRLLESLGLEVMDLRVWPDHYRFTAADLIALESTARKCGAAALICTVKDLVKLHRFQLTDIPVQALTLTTEFLAGETALRELLQRTLATGNRREIDVRRAAG